MKIPRIAYAAYGFALFIIVVDQITKAWVLSGLHLLDLNGAMLDRELWGYRSIAVLGDIFRITFVANEGVSFGLFGDGSARWFLSVFSVIVAAGLGWWALKADRRLLITAIGLVMGGAIGNVIDRIRFGFVVDFLDFSGTGVFPWVFNVADSAITVGIVVLVIDSLLTERAAKVGLAAEKS
ncbi:MAG: signal peptidase II [Brevundimonas sp.]|nr:MAG: signal peptidase II [Brevundimonas sp.]